MKKIVFLSDPTVAHTYIPVRVFYGKHFNTYAVKERLFFVEYTERRKSGA